MSGPVILTVLEEAYFDCCGKEGLLLMLVLLRSSDYADTVCYRKVLLDNFLVMLVKLVLVIPL